MPRRFTILLLLLMLAQPAGALVNLKKFGVVLTQEDSAFIKSDAKSATDSLMRLTRAKASVIYNIQRLRPFHNTTADFYLLSFLCLMLGAVRYLDPRYFALLVGAYRNPGAGWQWHEMLKAAALPNLGMNVFFAAVTGCYIYYVSGNGGNLQLGVRAPLVLPLLISGMLAIYAGKYAIVRFSGWAFRVEALSEQYLFNIFLVNKITGIVLLPFVILIAFAGSQWTQPIAILSGIIALILLSTRYLRSWPIFHTFFQGSKFHFFTYLCASEILPMAVLVKWLLHLLH